MTYKKLILCLMVAVPLGAFLLGWADYGYWSVRAGVIWAIKYGFWSTLIGLYMLYVGDPTAPGDGPTAHFDRGGYWP